jgi:hypothetical protein
LTSLTSRCSSMPSIPSHASSRLLLSGLANTARRTGYPQDISPMDDGPVAERLYIQEGDELAMNLRLIHPTSW